MESKAKNSRHIYQMDKPAYLDLEKTLQSGQHFQWKRIQDAYIISHGLKAWKIKDKEGLWQVEGSDQASLEDFFDLKTNYQPIYKSLEKEEALGPVLAFGQGLRILRQDPWDTCLAFILSTNNNMTRIQNSLFALASEYGPLIGTFDQEKVYGLPGPEKLSALSKEELREKVGAGYRDKYLVATAQMIHKKSLDLDSIYSLSYPRALEEITRLPGVGKKAGDCILLFAYGIGESFPVDTWMEKIMNQLYGPFGTREEIARFGQERFGPYAGYVQQLLFHYIRSQKTGR